jgi:hypothetical protein
MPSWAILDLDLHTDMLRLKRTSKSLFQSFPGLGIEPGILFVRFFRPIMAASFRLKVEKLELFDFR